MKQQELLHTSRIQLNELMANKDVDQPFIIQDSLINVTASLNFEELWNATLTINASLLRAEQNNTLEMCIRDRRIGARDSHLLRNSRLWRKPDSQRKLRTGDDYRSRNVRHRRRQYYKPTGQFQETVPKLSLIHIYQLSFG